MQEKINEELRQYKLYKIQITEDKLRRYNIIYSNIKEKKLLKLTKNAGSNISRLAANITSLVLLAIGILCFFPNSIIQNFDTNEFDEGTLLAIIKLSKFFILGLAVLFASIGLLLKKNNYKRNIIYNLSTLLEEVMMYLENASTEEKRKYEGFVDDLVEKEKASRNIN